MRIIPMIRIGCCVVVTAAILAGTAYAGAAEQVGVPTCDAFLTQYEACINTKIPQNIRALHQKEVDQWRKRWIELGTKDPAFKSSLGLGEICKNTKMLTAAVVETTFGCSFQ